jgi:hypothetical protein
MYNLKETYVSTTTNGKVEESSKLVAVFSFDDETAPKDRDNVKSRLNLNGILGTYLGEAEKIHKNFNGEYYTLIFEGNHIQSDSEKIGIRRHCRGLGLTLTIKKSGKFERKIDLEAMDHFIKTGERCQK